MPYEGNGYWVPEPSRGQNDWNLGMMLGEGCGERMLQGLRCVVYKQQFPCDTSCPWAVQRRVFRFPRYGIGSNIEVIFNVIRGLDFLCLCWVSGFAKKPKFASNPSCNMCHHSQAIGRGI